MRLSWVQMQFFLVKLGRGIVDQLCRNTSVMIPNLSVNREVQFSLRENQPGSNSVHIVGKCSSDALEQNPVQDTLAALLVHSQSCRMTRWVKYNWIWFGLFLEHRFTLSAGLVFSFWCVFWSCGSSVFQCSFLVSTAIAHQVRYVPEVISEPCSTLFFIVKWIWLRLSSHYGRLQFGCFRRKSSARYLSRSAMRVV